MRAGSLSRALALLSLPTMWIAASSAFAATDAPRRAVVYAPPDPEVIQRVRGQTADLSWELVVLNETPPTPEALESIVESGRRNGAAIVVWFDVLDGGFQVFAVDIERGDLLARRVVVTEQDEALSDSTLAETTAVVVRSILSSLSSGGRLGVEREAIAEEDETPTAPPVPAPAPAEPQQHAVRDARDAPDHGTPLLVGAGWQAGFDTADATPWHGPAIGLGVLLGRWHVGAVGSYALARDISDTLTRLRITRSELSGRFARRLGGERFRAEVGTRLGMLAYDRTTEALASGVVAAADQRTVSPMIAVETAGRVALLPGVPLDLVVAIGVDAAPRVPVLTYDGLDVDRERARLWPLQPRAAILLELGPQVF